MLYLCLIYLDEKQLSPARGGDERAQRPPPRVQRELLDSGHFIEAEALEPAAAHLRARAQWRTSLTDCPSRNQKWWPAST